MADKKIAFAPGLRGKALSCFTQQEGDIASHWNRRWHQSWWFSAWIQSGRVWIQRKRLISQWIEAPRDIWDNAYLPLNADIQLRCSSSKTCVWVYNRFCFFSIHLLVGRLLFTWYMGAVPIWYRFPCLKLAKEKMQLPFSRAGRQLLQSISVNIYPGL